MRSKPARPRKRQVPAREPLTRFLFPTLVGAVGGACIGYAVSAMHCQCSALASMDLHPVGVTILLGASAGVVREAIEPSSPFTPTPRRPWIIAFAAPSGLAGLIESILGATPWFAGVLLTATGAVAGAAVADYLTDNAIRLQEGRQTGRTPAGAVLAAGLLGHAAILGWLLR